MNGQWVDGLGAVRDMPSLHLRVSHDGGKQSGFSYPIASQNGHRAFLWNLKAHILQDQGLTVTSPNTFELQRHIGLIHLALLNTLGVLASPWRSLEECPHTTRHLEPIRLFFLQTEKPNPYRAQ